MLGPQTAQRSTWPLPFRPISGGRLYIVFYVPQALSSALPTLSVASISAVAHEALPCGLQRVNHWTLLVTLPSDTRDILDWMLSAIWTCTLNAVEESHTGKSRARMSFRWGFAVPASRIPVDQLQCKLVV